MIVSWIVCVGARHPSKFSSLNPVGQMLQIHTHITTDMLWHISVFRPHAYNHELTLCTMRSSRLNCRCYWWWFGEAYRPLAHHPFLLSAESPKLLCQPGITSHNAALCAPQQSHNTAAQHQCPSAPLLAPHGPSSQITAPWPSYAELLQNALMFSVKRLNMVPLRWEFTVYRRNRLMYSESNIL